MPLPNLGSHPNAVDMAAIGVAGAKQRDIRSNARDHLLDGSAHGAVDIDVSAGGTITPSLDERLANQSLRFTGSPATDPVLEIPETARQLVLENASTRAIVSTDADGDLLLEDGVNSLLLEDGSGNLLLEVSSSLVPIGKTRIFFKDGVTYREAGSVGAQSGAFLHDGSIPASGNHNWSDFLLSRAKFRDTAQTIGTAGAVVSGDLLLESGTDKLLLEDGTGVLKLENTRTLDMENGNVFTITLSENIAIIISNPPTTGKQGVVTLIVTQDGTGDWILGFPSEAKWEQDSGNSPGQTLTANATDIYSFVTTDAGSTLYSFVLGLDFQ